MSTEPSAVRIRVTVTRGTVTRGTVTWGRAGAAGTTSAAWLALGRAVAVPAEARAVAEAAARLDGLAGPPGCVTAGGELQAAIAHRPASEAAVQSLRMVHSLVRRVGPMAHTIRSLCQAAPSGSPAGAG